MPYDVTCILDECLYGSYGYQRSLLLAEQGDAVGKAGLTGGHDVGGTSELRDEPKRLHEESTSGQ